MDRNLTDVPELLPARMLNEFVYCPRLFYLEWVDRQWEPSDDTEHGKWVHRDVESRHGALPSDDDGAPATVRSVELSDSAWGLTAVVDRVDRAAGTCSPIEYKRGRPQLDGTSWPADRIQSLAQCALLEAAGFAVESGELSYAETHERVAVPWNDDARNELRSLIDNARETAAGLTPPPLIDSPKCPRCSLAGLCLPDEITLLRRQTQPRVKRILARDPDSSPLYVSEPGAYVSAKGGRLVVTKGGETLADVRLIDVQSLCVFGNVQVSTQAMTRLWARGAPVLFMSSGGWLNGWAQAPPLKNVNLRRRQVGAETSGMHIAAQIVNGKIRNQRTMLRRLGRGQVAAAALEEMTGLASRATSCERLPDLLGIEGGAARIYFDHFALLLGDGVAWRADFVRDGRTRRPPTDPVNAVLSYCYALLVKDMVAACLAVGLDPYVGVLHRPRFGRPSLALDLMEEFRPLVADSTALSLFNNGVLSAGDFVRRGVGVQLTTEARRKVISGYERRVAEEFRHPVYGYRVSYRRAFEIQARVLAATLVGEIPSYVPVVTR